MPIRVDLRLSTLASLVQGDVIADIGCDHGKLAYYLVGTERAKRVIATDISAPSLRKARELADENGARELIDTRLGDGLEPIESGEADTVVIAGLGGDVISNIIARAYKVGKRFECYVTAPNTHAEKVRRTLISSGHRIVYDDILQCAGKRYTVIKAVRGEMKIDELQELFGVFYADNQNFEQLAKSELEQKRSLYQISRSDELAKRIEILERALANYVANGK